MSEINDTTKRHLGKENSLEHKQDHKSWSRRSFLHSLGLMGGAGVALGGFSVGAMASPSLLPSFLMEGPEDRILVLIRLKGGNDGLNMVIPVFNYGAYAQARPSIKIPENEITALNDKFGLPSTMDNLNDLWNNGAMKVINSVGYDNQNLSHFSSSDIWNSANQDIQSSIDKSGWLGRYLLFQDPDYLENLPEVPGAIKISSGGSISYYNPDQIDLAVNFNTPDRLLEVAESGVVYDVNNLPDDCYYGEQVGYLRSILNVTYNYAPKISEAFLAAQNSVAYSSNELSRQLAIVARLIKGNLGTRLYMVTLDGFDTHENQNEMHPILMRFIADAVSEFYNDLKSDDLDKNVLSMTFSEFGRRIQENTNGTDHGAAAPLMMFGPELNGSDVLGKDPDFNDVDQNGNLKHDIDFRQIYASILEYWLCLNPVDVDTILGDSYERMDNLGFACDPISSTTTPVKQNIVHGVRPNPAGGMVINYTLDRPGNINLTVYTIMGQKLKTLHHGYQTSGAHQANFILPYGGYSALPLVYKIEAQGRSYSGKFVMAN